jgi:hypothetical protein
MRFEWWNAALLFVLWLAQFLVAHWRDELCWVYAAWAAGLILSWTWRPPIAGVTFVRMLRQGRKKEAPPRGRSFDERNEEVF